MAGSRGTSLGIGSSELAVCGILRSGNPVYCSRATRLAIEDGIEVHFKVFEFYYYAGSVKSTKKELLKTSELFPID